MSDEILKDFWSTVAPTDHRTTVADLIIPSLANEISESAFFGHLEIITLTISNGVQVIGDMSFGCCQNLRRVKIPASVNKIGLSAFLHCDKLEEIDVDPDNVDYCSINGVLFRRNPFELLQYPLRKSGLSYSVPQGVERIGNSAFDHCAELETIELPTSLQAIDNSAFCNCEKLKCIKIPDSVTDFGAYILHHCTALKEFSFPLNMDIIPEGILSECTGLCEVDIPIGVKIIQPQAFSRCSGLQRISLPQGIEEIFPDCFDDCSNLERFTVSPDSLFFCEIDGVLYSKGKDVLVRIPPNYPGECFAVPESVRKIEDSAFESCKNITKIVLSSKVKSIGYQGFRKCTGITEIEIPEGVESLGISDWLGGFETDDPDEFDFSSIPSVFDECTSLERIVVTEENSQYCSIDGVLFSKDRSQILCFPSGRKQKEYSIPEGVTIIGSGAFSDCTQLQHIEIPTSVKCINNWAFNNCTGLTQIIIPSSLDKESQTAFWGCDARIIRK